MPVADYQCPACELRFEHFFHSSPPDEHACDECGQPSSRVYSYPGEYRPTNARKFEDIVIWQANDDLDKFSFPGRANEPVQEGYHEIRLSSMRDYERVFKHINSVETRELDLERESVRQYYNDRTKQRRDNIRAKIGSDARLNAMHRAIIQHLERKRDRQYRYKSMERQVFAQALEMNSSNRMDFCDKDTGFRAVKR